jgi:3-oxoacyl-[acyl-carrier-protein] synthase II
VTNRRVAITGIGVVSPHGTDANEMFDALLKGKSAIRRVELKSDVGSFQTVGGTVTGEPWLTLPQGSRVTSDRVGQYSLLAAAAAISDAKLDFNREDRSRVGASVGTSLGGVSSEEFAYGEILARGKTRLSPFTLVKVMYNGPAAHLGLAHVLAGPTLTYTKT